MVQIPPEIHPRIRSIPALEPRQKPGHIVDLLQRRRIES